MALVNFLRSLFDGCAFRGLFFDNLVIDGSVFDYEGKFNVWNGLRACGDRAVD